jgi:hypothetical protein
MGTGELLTQLGVGGIFAILVIRMVLDFLAKRRNGASASATRDLFALVREVRDLNVILKNAVVEMAPLVRGTCERVAELHRWHDRVDDDGVMVWYTRKSLDESIRVLNGGVKDFTQAICRLNELLEKSAHD